MSNLEPITHYVLMVSNHNIAEFRECLYLKPKNIYLVTTKRMQKHAERLQRQLISSLPDSTIQILNGDNFEGNYYAEINEWIATDFLPITKTWQEGKAIFNMTGSTKMLSTMILQCFNGWHEVHYVPHDDKRKNLEVECFTLNQGGLLYKKSITIDEILSPITAISLYADDIKSIDENPCRKSKDSLDLALMRLKAQTIDGIKADNPFTDIVPILNELWWQNKSSKEEKVLIQWTKFGLDRNIIQPFLERLDNLNESPILTYSDEGVLMPSKKVFGGKSKKHKMAKNWIKWIEGDWFEQLVYHWLLQVGLTKNAVATSVDIKRDKQDNSGETDLLVFYGQNVCFLETKADKNPEQSFTDFQRQLTSQSDGLGLVKKYLILAPKIKKQADLQQWESFERLCKSRQVDIIIAENAESFRKHFGNS